MFISVYILWILASNIKKYNFPLNLLKIMMISFKADGLDAMGLVITNCTAKRADSQPINSADPDTQLGTDGQLIIGENA